MLGLGCAVVRGKNTFVLFCCKSTIEKDYSPEALMQSVFLYFFFCRAYNCFHSLFLQPKTWSRSHFRMALSPPGAESSVKAVSKAVPEEELRAERGIERCAFWLCASSESAFIAFTGE